jgi:RNA polymerase sigma factor (sigma-70 family)
MDSPGRSKNYAATSSVRSECRPRRSANSHSSNRRITGSTPTVAGLEGEIGTLGDLLEDPLSSDQYEEVLDSIAGRQLRGLLGHLTERERDIIDSRFGFERPAEKLTAIGSRLGISAERVRQIEDRALTKMRQGSR